VYSDAQHCLNGGVAVCAGDNSTCNGFACDCFSGFDGTRSLRQSTGNVHVDGTKTDMRVIEGEVDDQYSIVLSTEPYSMVTIQLHTDIDCYRDCGIDGHYPEDERLQSCGATTGGKLCNTTVYPTELAFSPSNWSFPRNVTVMPVDDELDEPTHHISTMEYTTLSDDLKYFNISIEKTTVHITDNDHARINIYQVVNALLVKHGTVLQQNVLWKCLRVAFLRNTKLL
jgi:hypothetical protein